MACDRSGRPVRLHQWREFMNSSTKRIRALNDELRKHLIGGLAVITPGVAALGQEAVERIVKTLAIFDDFCEAIDYYDTQLTYHSPDPANPAVTERVITIMLADEY